MARNKKANWLSMSLNGLFFLIPVCFSLYFFNRQFLFMEEVFQGFFLDEKITDLYLEADHGCFISSILMKIFASFLPLSIGFHPSDNLFGIAFMGFNASILIFVISKFAVESSRRRGFFYPLMFYVTTTFLFFTFFLIQEGNIYHLFTVYSRHFRYLFFMIFYCVFWLYFYKWWSTKEKVKIGKLVLMCFVSFVVGLSSEPVSICTFASLFLFFFCSFFFFRAKIDSIEKLRKLFIKKRVLRRLLSVLLPVFFFLLGFLLLFSHPSFHSIAGERCLADGNSEKTLGSFFLLVADFIPLWFKYTFVLYGKAILASGVLFLSVLLLLISRDRKTLKTVLFSWLLLMGTIIFRLSLIMTKKHYSDTSIYWFDSVFLRFVSSLIFIIVLALLFGRLVNILHNKKRLKVLSLIITTAICLSSVFYFYYIWKTVGSEYLFNIKSETEKSRQLWYMSEKMYLFYNEKKEVAKLPYSIRKDPLSEWEFCDQNYDYVVKSAFLDHYIVAIYKKKREEIVSIKLVPDQIAIKEFYKRGGTFAENEVKEAKYTRLLDKNFVVNKEE